MTQFLRVMTQKFRTLTQFPRVMTQKSPNLTQYPPVYAMHLLAGSHTYQPP